MYDYTGTAAANSATIQFGTGTFSMSDSENITMAADGSCTGENTTSISCSVTPTSIDVDLAGNADGGSLNNVGLTGVIPLTVQGGSGNDNFTITSNFSTGAVGTATINDTSGNDTYGMNVTTLSGVDTVGYGTVSGGTGADTVSGTATVNGDGGADILRGLGSPTGSVTLNGGTENDTFGFQTGVSEIANGGGGTDTADFTQVSGVTVTLDAAANDGSVGGQNDNANADSSVEVVKTNQGNDTVTGGPGADTITTGEQNDTINGGGGDDTIDGQTGADVMNGGANGAAGDTVTYADRGNPLRVSPDGLDDNDGEAGEFDNVGADVENIIGGFDNDSIGGNAGNNTFNGGLGLDSFEGAAGNDTLIGGSGDDRLDGGANNDSISGGPGDDTIDGGADVDALNGDGGADLIDGAGGTDTLNGNAGSDTLLTRDNVADTANCGDGTDHSVHDVAGDTVNADCEISDTGSAGFVVESTPQQLAVPQQQQQTIAGSTDVAVVTCTTSRSKKSGRVRVRCTVALNDPKAGGVLKARLVRGHRTVALGKRNGSGSLTLRSKRRAKHGRYTLVLTHNGAEVARVKIRI